MTRLPSHSSCGFGPRVNNTSLCQVLRRRTLSRQTMHLDHRDGLFRPRQESRTFSRKPSTVRVRENELRRAGLDAATLKIQTKWRGRRLRARERLTAVPAFNELQLLAPHIWQRYFQVIDRQFNRLRDEEIEFVSHVWDSLRHNE